MGKAAERARSVCCALVVVCLAYAAPADASVFCVAPATGCSGGQKPTLQAALDAALAALGPDKVQLPSGVVNGPGAYDTANPDNTVDLVGAGREATIVTSAATGYVLDIRRAGLVSDLTVKQPNPPVAGQEGALLIGTVERVGLSSADSGFDSDISGTARHILSSGPARLGVRGTLEDSQLSGGPLATGTGDTIVRRVRGVAPEPIFGQNRSLAVSSSLFISTAPGGTVAGFSPSPVPNSHATVVLSNVTLIGAGGAGCVGISASGDNVYGPPNDFAVQDMTVANTIVRNCATTLIRNSGGGNRTSNITVFNSDIDLSPAAVTQSGNGTLTAGAGDGNVNLDPLFLGLPGFEQLLRFDSPAIDRGLTSLVSPEESATDLGGDPRVADGNGDGVATRDIGAFEYQRRALAVTATAIPSTAEIGQTIAFMGTATEVDTGETVTGLTWRFDDGTTSTSATTGHAFAAAGSHTATLTASDSAGVVATATATVTVLAAPAVQSISLSPTTFRVVLTRARTAARRRIPTGTTVSLVRCPVIAFHALRGLPS